MTPIERMKLSKQLLGLRSELQGATNALQRMKLSRQILELRAQLGAGAPAAKAEPAPEQVPQPVAQDGAAPHIAALLAVVQGQHDAEGLQALYERIKAAVQALDGLGALSGAGADVANEAIDHWAALESKA